MQLLTMSNKFNGKAFLTAVRELKASQYDRLLNGDGLHFLAAMAWHRRLQLYSSRYRPMSIWRLATNKAMMLGDKAQWYATIQKGRPLLDAGRAEDLLCALRTEPTVRGRYQHICKALGFTHKSVDGSDVLAGKNLLQLVHAVGLAPGPELKGDLPHLENLVLFYRVHFGCSHIW